MTSPYTEAFCWSHHDVERVVCRRAFANGMRWAASASRHVKFFKTRRSPRRAYRIRLPRPNNTVLRRSDRSHFTRAELSSSPSCIVCRPERQAGRLWGRPFGRNLEISIDPRNASIRLPQTWRKTIEPRRLTVATPLPIFFTATSWASNPESSRLQRIRGVSPHELLVGRSGSLFNGKPQTRAYVQGCSYRRSAGLMEVKSIPAANGVSHVAPSTSLTHTSALVRNERCSSFATLTAGQITRLQIMRGTRAGEAQDGGRRNRPDPRTCSFDPATHMPDKAPTPDLPHWSQLPLFARSRKKPIPA